ncbi:MAG: hypothetical protein ACYTGL_22140 [Planctomycetota bacterium]
MFRILATALLLLAASVLSGCHTARKLELTSTGSPAFEQFSAAYEIPSAAELLSRGFAATEMVSGRSSDDHPHVQQVAASQTSAAAATSTARLTIECPPPSGDINTARLLLEFRPGHQDTRGMSLTQRRQLTIPRQQIDLLILDLARAGFFDEPEHAPARSSLNVTIDGSRVTRRWKLDDRLLDFAHRTLQHGGTTPE